LGRYYSYSFRYPSQRLSRFDYMNGEKKNKLATLKDRLDNALKDDHTALRQLKKTLPLSEAAKKRLKNDKHPRNRK